MTTIATRSKLERARAHQEAGRAKRAKDLYHQILREDPVCTEALFNLALMLCDAGELAAAVEYFQRLIAQDPNLPDVHFNLGTVLARLGRAEEAVKAYVEAIALQPEMADAYNNLGILLRDCGQDEQALVCFDQALNHAPTLLAPRVNLVTTLVRLHRPDEAIEAAHHAVEQFPSSGEAHNVLGLALDCAGRWDEAVVSLHEAIRLKPDADVWRYFLAARGGSSTPETAPSRYVASLFDRYAERFDEHLVNVLQYRVPDHLFDAVVKTEHDRRFEIIDLGCGTGLCGDRFRALADRLIGVDLSPQMIKAAQLRGCYHELHEGDIAAVLRTLKTKVDLVLSADVFIYVGDLAEVFALVAQALRPSGLFAYSVESYDGDSYALGPHARYSHGLPYLRHLAAANNLQERWLNEVVLRREGDTDVKGWVIVAEKT